MAWTLNLAYMGLLVLVSPILLYKRLVLGKYRTGWSEKLRGRLPSTRQDRRCAWFHAVSVGEVLQLQKVIPQFIAAYPEFDVVLTTTTSTGYELAMKRFPNCLVSYCPLDFSWAVRRAVRRLRPELLVLVELELWPNLIQAAHAAGARLVLINGRVSSKSYHGYRWIRPLMRWLLNRFELLAVQNEVYADRLRKLGANPARLHVTGSIKCDQLVFDRMNEKTLELRRLFRIGENECVLVAGSTQAPEEAIALRCYEKLAAETPNLRLILVPRHPERFREVQQLVESHGWQLIRKSQPSSGEPLRNARPDRKPILLLDTVGDLAACWGLANIAFVGGSLTSRGGQNMMEPAAYGAAVTFGPNTQNFRDVVELLLQEDAAIVISGEGEMLMILQQLLQRPQRTQAMGQRACELVQRQQGATERTLDLLSQLVNDKLQEPAAGAEKAA